jgi:SSS family solute:Na+ symporter
VTVLVSMMSAPRPETELEGLVYGLTKVPHDASAKWYQRPAPLAIFVSALVIFLNIWFA